MNLLLVHAKPLDRLGGAELSLKAHVASAPPGVHVEVVLPDAHVDINQFDTVVLANLRPSGGQGQKAELKWAKLWAKHLHGYRGYVIKSERDIHPCVHRDGRCIQVDPLRKDPCGCNRKITAAFEKLYNMCDAVQFLSPLHRQAINLLIDVRQPLQYEIASPIDLSMFRNVMPFAERKRAALITGDAIRVAPTAEQMARDEGYEVETMDYLSVPYEEMPDILNQYQAVVVDPVMLHAFGRITVEAMACGCRVIASRRVGAMSWPDPVRASGEANDKFWAMVQQRPSAPNPSRFSRLTSLVRPG